MDIIFGQLLKAVGATLDMVLQLFFFLLVVRAVASWFSPDPRNPLMQFLYASTEPLLSRIRAKIPPMGMIDVSVIVAILGIYFIQIFVAGSLIMYGDSFSAARRQVVSQELGVES